jgi:hypothetical protein
VAEDQAADRPGQEADRERAERRELRRPPIEAVEEELVEDEPGSGAVEEEVVPLDGGAHRRGEGHPARGGRAELVVVVMGHDQKLRWLLSRSWPPGRSTAS